MAGRAGFAPCGGHRRNHGPGLLRPAALPSGDRILILALALGLALLAGLILWYVRVILRSDYPGIRAAEALAATTPLFLLLFASAYFVLSREIP